MNKICTTIEESKKLIELGIDVNTADMVYGYIAPYDFSDRMYDGGYDKIPYIKDFFKFNPNFSENEYDGGLPAWSLSALLSILTEQDFIIKTIENEFNIDIPIRHCKVWFSSLLDAAFEMVVWLLKNKKL